MTLQKDGKNGYDSAGMSRFHLSPLSPDFPVSCGKLSMRSENRSQLRQIDGNRPSNRFALSPVFAIDVSEAAHG